MIKNKHSFEVKCGERIYQFLSDQDAPAIDVREVLIFMLKYVDSVLEAANKPVESHEEVIEPELIEV